MFLTALITAATTTLAACAGSSTSAETPTVGVETLRPASSEATEQQYPDVLEAALTRDGDEFMISVTISSPYDTPERYADGWRVMTPDGDVLAEHELAHDHASEQPFTRTRGPFTIPDGVTDVVVEGRDQANGYGGAPVTVAVPT